MGDWGQDGEEDEEMTLAACMHAAAATAGNVELRTQCRATVAGSCSTTFPVPGAEPSQAGGRMREPASAAQEAHTEEGSWRARGADKAV
jgi:hypothetical protein